MPFNLTFELFYNYPNDANGITIPVKLQHGNLSIPTTAKVDPGSEVCLFGNEIAYALDIEVEDGLPILLDSLGGRLEAFGHEVVIHTFDYSFPSFAYFAKEPGLRRNLLGRQGWLRQFKIGLVDYDSTIYLCAYDE